MTPSSHGEDETVAPASEAPILPATVAAAHLESCAASLAADTVPRRALGCVADVHELDEAVRLLTAGQHHISTTLTNLARHLDNRQFTGQSAELVALIEVLQAASNAAGHSAEALKESFPLLETMVASADGDTRL